MTLTRRTALFAGAAALIVPATAFAKAKPVYTEGKIAIDGRGAVAPTVPEAWEIVDGKLYLNFNWPRALDDF